MASSSRRIVQSLQRLSLHEIRSKPSLRSSIPSNSSNLSSSLSPNPSIHSEIWRKARSSEFISRPTAPNGVLSRLLSRRFTTHNSHSIPPSGPSISRLANAKTPIGIPPLSSRLKGINGRRLLSTKGFNFGKFDGGVAKSVVDKPLNAARSAFLRYREALGLQVEAFLKRNYPVLVGAGAVVLCVALWRIMFGIASTFVGLSEGMAKYGFLALAAAVVTLSGLYVRSRYTINPDKLYRIAMRKLNTSAGILEVMGAPLTGTDVRAYVMSGGGPQLKNLKMRFGGKRCFLIFPIRGSERRGLVSVEVKKKKGQYDLKLLAVDIPMASGPEQRLFLIGDEQEYKVGGGLISELRDPIVKAMAAEKEFEYLDQKEEEEDEVRELEEAERKRREEEERALEAERKRREMESLEKESH